MERIMVIFGMMITGKSGTNILGQVLQRLITVLTDNKKVLLAKVILSVIVVTRVLTTTDTTLEDGIQ